MHDFTLHVRIGSQALRFFQVSERFRKAAGDAGKRDAEIVLRIGKIRP